MSSNSKCRRFQELLEQQIETGTPGKGFDIGFLGEHRRECPACDMSTRIVEQLENMGPEEPSPELGNAELEMKVHRILALNGGAEHSRLGRRSLLWRLGYGLAGAAVVVIGLGVYLWLRSMSQRPERHKQPTASDALATAPPEDGEQDGTGARVVAVTGVVDSDGRALAAEEMIATGDGVQTRSGTARLRFPDGTLAVMDGNTRLRLVRSQPTDRLIEIARGRVTFAVTPLGPGQTFVVDTLAGKLRVRGTVFDVSLGAGRCEIRVAEGAVELLAPSKPAVPIRAGETLICSTIEHSELHRTERDEMLRLVGREPPLDFTGTPDGGPAEPRRSASVGMSGSPDRAQPTDEVLPQVIEDVPPVGDQPTITELLDRVGTWRARQHWPYVVATYQQLIRLHPGSPEARTCLVPMGKVQMERLGQPGLALGSFRRYLRVAPNGSLAEEAAWNSVVALRRLGRTAEEIDALRQFLRRHPASLYAPWATERLRQLESPQQ